MPIGIIIIAVAVLDTHIDNSAVAIMKPAIRRVGFTPTRSTMWMAMRLCRFHRCNASANRNPPRKSRMVLLA